MEIEMTDTQQTCRVMALLDSGAIELFLDLEFVKHHSLTTQPLSKPILVYNVDEMPNKAGTINSMDLIAEGIVCVYLDNILIYTKMLEEHYWITCLILECLCQHQLYLKLEKCKFEQTYIEYLGLIISRRATEMDLVKVAGVAEWLELKNKKEVQVFLGSQTSTKDSSRTSCTHPLFKITGKDVTWSWGPLEQTAFDTLKCTMTSGPILLFSDNNSPFQVEADSSNFATGAVLSQQSPEDGKWYLVAFSSKSLNVVEQNYKIHDKEMLAII
ncbi:hypothetical protein E4T56_gene8517 [Termitomyces sp. T112]|nr:hypothetical protein E4T56_gene8517 [Termitomyces sp. T112]